MITRLMLVTMALVAAAACGSIKEEVDAPPSAIDAPPDTIDAPSSPIDAFDAEGPIDAPIDAPDVCVPRDDNRECTDDVCQNGQPVNINRPRDTLCNGLRDQCDGLGNCVDCTNNGGCEDCCVCRPNQTCVPA